MICYQMKMQLTKQNSWCDFFCQKKMKRKKKHQKISSKYIAKLYCLFKSFLVITSELWDNW